MIKEYLKTGIRNILSNKLFSAINIFGLAIGLVSSMLIFSWVQGELSYDKFHENAPELYRLIGNGMVSSPQPLAPVLKQDFPEIVNSSRLQSLHDCKLEYDKTIFNVKPTTIDNSFFEMFSFNFIEGDSKTVLQAPSSMVVSQSFANRLFGDKKAMGQKLTILFFGQIMDFYVTGILEDMPSNSHIKTDCFVSMPDFIDKLYGGDLSEWSDWAAVTYIQTQKNSSIEGLKEKITDCVLAHTNNRSDYKAQLIQPIEDIHLHSDFKNEYADCRDIKYVFIFSVIAFIILLIACINYANNTTSLAMKRLKEVGIRKVIGATRITLIKQMTIEALLLLTITAIIAFVMLRFLVPMFGNLVGNELAEISPTTLILFFSVSILLISIIVGLSQTSYFLSFRTISVLQSRIRISNNKISGKAVLTTVQFALAIIIIIGAIGVKKQIFHVQNMNLGFDDNNLVYFPLVDNSSENIALLKDELLKDPNVLGFTSGHLLTQLNRQNTNSINWAEKNPDENYYANIQRVDFDFQETYQTEIKEGRFFSEDLASDKTSAFVLNESAVRTFGIQSPVGKTISIWGQEGTIIGIINDYFYETAHNVVSPAILWMNSEMNFPGFESITLRIRSKNIAGTIQFAQNTIEKHNNGYNSEFHFLDSAFDNMYKTEQRFSIILTVASLLAILISCTGLFALISFAVRKRIKEIGIRKVNGASEITIMGLLSKDIVKWVVIALVVATPVAWIIMNKWLENFAYKINLSWWIFALAGLLALGIALLTVSWQSWRAATRNPVEALRYE